MESGTDPDPKEPTVKKALYLRDVSNFLALILSMRKRKEANMSLPHYTIQENNGGKQDPYQSTDLSK